jgi:hypothetical protein
MQQEAEVVTAVETMRRRRMRRRCSLGWQARALLQVQPPWGQALQGEQLGVHKKGSRWQPRIRASYHLLTR